MRVTGTPYAAHRYLAAAGAVMTLGQAGALAVVYFLTARLGLALQAQPSDVAVFWPASGVAAGFLIMSRRRAYPAASLFQRPPHMHHREPEKPEFETGHRPEQNEEPLLRYV